MLFNVFFYFVFYFALGEVHKAAASAGGRKGRGGAPVRGPQATGTNSVSGFTLS